MHAAVFNCSFLLLKRSLMLQAERSPFPTPNALLTLRAREIENAT